MIKEILLDFFKFIKKPNDVQYNWLFKKKLLTLTIIFCIKLLFAYLIVLPLLEYISQLYIIDDKRVDYSGKGIAFLIMIAVLLGPIVEEGVFRLVQRYQGFTEMLFTREKWDKVFPYVVYFISIFFGLIHLIDYSNNLKLLLILSPIIIGSQFLGGLSYSYLRVRFNMYWNIIAHCVWNLLVGIIIPYLYFNSVKPYSDINKKYHLQVKKIYFYDHLNKQKFSIDTLADGKIKMINTNQLSLRHTLDTLYGNNKYKVNDFIANIKFKSELGVSKDDFISIIDKEYKVFNQQ